QRLVLDVQRLPDRQRSAMLLLEWCGMSYVELADALDVKVPAVKSLLVWARMSLAAAAVARDIDCEQIRVDLAQSHDGRVQPTAITRLHLHDCSACCEFRSSIRE